MEYDVMDFAVNATSNYNNVSVILRNFNVSENINLFNQGKVIGFISLNCTADIVMTFGIIGGII